MKKKCTAITEKKLGYTMNCVHVSAGSMRKKRKPLQKLKHGRTELKTKPAFKCSIVGICCFVFIPLHFFLPSHSKFFPVNFQYHTHGDF